MAVVPGSLCLHWRGATATWDATSERYIAVWRLKTDDPQDQGQTLVHWFVANVVPRGTPYTYGNDNEPTTAVSENYTANRVDNSLISWEIVVEFNTPARDTEDEQDTGGSPEQDPTKWRPRIQVGTTPHSRIVQNAQYRGGYGAGFNLRFPDAGSARVQPMNSAFVPFTNPPVEQDASSSWVRIGWNYPRPIDADKVMARENFVNIQAFKIDIRGVVVNFAEREAKIKRIEVEPRLANGVYYVEINWLIERAIPFRDRGAQWKVWDSFVQDEGTHARALIGDPDGKGGTIADDGNPTGRPRLRPLTDVNDQIIYDPVPFDGDGQPLDVQAQPAPPEVFARWRHYDEMDYHLEDYLKDLITAGP